MEKINFWFFSSLPPSFPPFLPFWYLVHARKVLYLWATSQLKCMYFINYPASGILLQQQRWTEKEDMAHADWRKKEAQSTCLKW
jgi:hypothetical protein